MHCPPRPEPKELAQAFAPFKPQVSHDPTRNGPWWNLRQCLTMPRDPATTHLLVLNDDVLPTPGVIVSVRSVARANRDGFVSLYSYHPALLQAKKINCHWIPTYTWTWGCAQLIRVDLIEPFLKFNDEHVRDDWNIDDTRWALFACFRGKPNYVFAPSLVDHREDWDSVHMPGKQHRKTDWLSGGPILGVSKKELIYKEQDPASYLRSRPQWMKETSQYWQPTTRKDPFWQHPSAGLQK